LDCTAEKKGQLDFRNGLAGLIIYFDADAKRLLRGEASLTARRLRRDAGIEIETSRHLLTFARY
jgi:hypothetical protein